MSRILETIETSALRTAAIYAVLLGGSFVVAPFPAVAGLFSLFQILLAVADVDDAGESPTILPNLVAALVNGGLCYVLNDAIGGAFAILAFIVVVARILKLYY